MSSEREYYRSYPWYDPARAVVRTAGRQIRDRASRYFRGRLIEIGCGTKAKRHLVGEFVDEHVGLDHRDCPHDPSNIDLFGSADAIPAPDASFDCALSTAVLEHLEEPEAALREACRVLRPGAYAVYTAPLFWHLHEEPRDFFRYTRFGLEHLFRRAGFEIVEITPLSGFWITFGSATSYYVQRFARGLLRYPVRCVVGAIQWIVPRLDRGRFRDERFTWMYLAVVRKPPAEGDTGPVAPR